MLSKTCPKPRAGCSVGYALDYRVSSSSTLKASVVAVSSPPASTRCYAVLQLNIHSNQMQPHVTHKRARHLIMKYGYGSGILSARRPFTAVRLHIALPACYCCCCTFCSSTHRSRPTDCPFVVVATANFTFWRNSAATAAPSPTTLV